MSRVNGKISSEMAELLFKRALALKGLRRFKEARSATAASSKIIEEVYGKGDAYVFGLEVLAEIEYAEGKYKEGLKRVEEARSLMKPEGNPYILARILNLHALLLTEMEQYQKAVLVQEEELALRFKINGPNHPDYAVTLRNAALLYAKLNKWIGRSI